MYKDLPRNTASDKVLHNKAFALASNPECDGYQRGLTSMVYKFFDKKYRDPTTRTGAGIISKEHKLDNELNKPITRKFKKRKVYSSFPNEIWGYRS